MRKSRRCSTHSPASPADGPTLERVALATLREDPRNCRVHTPRNLAAIRESLKQFGQQKPVVIDADNVILAGNGLYLAALELGWTHLLCVRSGLAGVAKAAYAVADNRTAELSEWDEARLAEVAAEMAKAQIDVPGFDPAELERLMATAAEPASPVCDRRTTMTTPGRIKAVLVGTDAVHLFESALLATGEVNRCEALKRICREFLENHPETQLDLSLEGALEAGGPPQA